MDSYRILVIAHVAAGTVALLAYWSAAIARKGGRLHRRVGQAYLLAMVAVLATSVVLAGTFFARGQAGIGTFLAYLALLTATACWQGWTAVRRKDAAEFHGRGYTLLAWSNMVAGLATLWAGLALGHPLLLVFCWIGILAGAVGLLQQRRFRAGRGLAVENRRWWLREHFQSMLGTGVATHVAFLAIGLNRLLSPFGVQAPQLLAWLLPVAVAVGAGMWLDRRYGFAGRRSAGKRAGGGVTAAT
jgi:uncharacterized membrane protein